MDHKLIIWVYVNIGTFQVHTSSSNPICKFRQIEFSWIKWNVYMKTFQSL